MQSACSYRNAGISQNKVNGTLGLSQHFSMDIELAVLAFADAAWVRTQTLV